MSNYIPGFCEEIITDPYSKLEAGLAIVIHTPNNWHVSFHESMEHAMNKCASALSYR